MKNTKLFLFIIIVLLIAGCFWDEARENKKLVKDFWLNWWAQEDDLHILNSFDIDGNGGIPVIKRTVFAVGFDSNFIIAKQHPDKEEEVQDRLFNYDTIEGAYLLENSYDTVWLSGEDSIYKKNGKWYHISNGWSPPDSLRPYKRITFYHIIDIRHYQLCVWDSYKVYTFNTEKEFNAKRQELGVPRNLVFSILKPNLE